MLALSGASGLLGRYICDELVVRGVPFKLLGREANNTPVKEGFPFCYYDFSRPLDDSLRFFLDDVDVLIHLAALLPNPASQTIDYFSYNSVAPKVLFDLCSDAGVDRFVFLSGSNIMQPLAGLVTANSPYASNLRQPPYLVSKIAGELLLLNSSSSSDLLIVRPSSIYGHGMRSGLFRILYDSFSNNKSVTLSSGGLFMADFIYAADVATIILNLIEETFSGVFNVGTGFASSAYQVAKEFLSVLGLDEDLIILDPFVDVSPSVESLPIVSSDQTTLLLGRSPLSLAEGINHAIKKYGSI
jgi:nucleoside-diphosphate-sugar epimerase